MCLSTAVGHYSRRQIDCDLRQESRHDGSCYWVLALVIPVDAGYLSIRLKPTSPFVRRRPRHLRNDCSKSNESSKDRAESADRCHGASREELQKLLVAKRLSNYEKFMLQALALELASRKRELTKRIERNSRFHNVANSELRRQSTRTAIARRRPRYSYSSGWKRSNNERRACGQIDSASITVRVDSILVDERLRNCKQTRRERCTTPGCGQMLGVVCDEGRFLMNHLSSVCAKPSTLSIFDF